MAGPFFVKVGGNDSNDGLSWDASGTPGAFATISQAITTAAAGETIVVDYNLTQSATTTIAMVGGTSAAPKVLISAEPQSSGTTITYHAGAKYTTNTGDVELRAEWRAYGVTLETTASGGDIYLCSTTAYRQQFLYGCTLSVADRLFVYVADGQVFLHDCTISGGTSSNHLIATYGGGSRLEMRGGSISWSNSNASYCLLYTYGLGSAASFFGVDLSSLEDTVKLVATTDHATRAVFSGCKLPAGWDTNNVGTYGATVLVERSSNSNRTATAAGLSFYDHDFGHITHDTATYRTGGASDGDNYYSWEFKGAQAYCTYYNPLVSPPITAWVDGDGSSKTVTIHFAIDSYSSDSHTISSDLTPAEVWFDILTPNETASPNTTHQDRYQTCRADVGSTASTHTTGDAWTGSAVGATYKYSFTIAPALPGPVIVRAYVATPKNEVYVCPKIDIA